MSPRAAALRARVLCGGEQRLLARRNAATAADPGTTRLGSKLAIDPFGYHAFIPAGTRLHPVPRHDEVRTAQELIQDHAHASVLLMASVHVGVISDTHGLVRPQAVEALRGVDAILHAGDVGSPEVLQELGEIAPVHAVRGNVDRDVWAKSLPLRDAVEIGGRLIYIVHDIADLDLDPAAAEIAIVVSGHSHRPGAERRNGVLYLNPGSAGPRRFRLPVALARIRISPAALSHDLIELEV